jgi:adenosine/AMP kinase
MEIISIKIQPIEDSQLILAQSHFIKTVEDVHECMVNSVSNIKFDISFCEASGPSLIRHQGNDEYLKACNRICTRLEQVTA